MPRRGIVDAYTAGRRFANYEIMFGNNKGKYKVSPDPEKGEFPLEDLILIGMERNPYKSPEKIKDFNDGVSDWVNREARAQQHKVNEGGNHDHN